MVPADGERTGLNLWLREDPEQPVPEKVLEDSKRLVTWILRDRGVTADLDFDLAVADAPEQGGMQW
jgi:hypothetical protein